LLLLLPLPPLLLLLQLLRRLEACSEPQAEAHV
jgi:hypothetical protein